MYYKYKVCTDNRQPLISTAHNIPAFMSISIKLLNISIYFNIKSHLSRVYSGLGPNRSDLASRPITESLRLKANKFSTGELDICIKYDEGMRLDEVAINITHSSQNLPSECYEYGKGYSLYGTTIGGYDFRIWTKVGLKYLKEIPGRYNVEGAYIDDIRGVLDGA